ncbi:MAG TPA: hypothetical protein VF077_13365 [Nitrospiraceae bacterium]
MRQVTLLNPVGAGQVVTIVTGQTTSTNVLGTADMPIRGVLCTPTVDCFVEIVPPATSVVAAVNTSTFVPAYHEVPFEAQYGSKVSVIRLTSDGSLYIRPLL